MSTLQPILVVADPAKPHSRAVRRAAMLARDSGAPLHLCTFVHERLIDFAGRIGADAVSERARHDLVLERMQALEKLGSELAGHGHAVEIEVVWAPRPHEAILAQALQRDAWLVVKDAGAGLARTAGATLDRSLARVLPCGLWLAAPGDYLLPKRIVVGIDVLAEPIDADGLNLRILGAALRIADYAGAEVDVAAVSPFEAVGQTMLLGAKQLLQQAHGEFDRAYRAFMELHRIPGERRHRLSGYPADALAQQARSIGAQLVVVGGSYREGLDRLLLGSTAEILLNQTGFDTLVVKGPGFASVLAQHIDLPALSKRYREGDQA